MKKVLIVLGLLMASGGCSSPTDTNRCGSLLGPVDFDPHCAPASFSVLVVGVVTESGLPLPAVGVTLQKNGVLGSDVTNADGRYLVENIGESAAACTGFTLTFVHPDGRSAKVVVPSGCAVHSVNYEFDLSTTGKLFVQPPQDRGVNYGAPHYADDFTLGESATIKEFRWWGADGSNSTTAVRIFADDGSGAPGLDPFFEVLNPVVLTSPATSVVPRSPALPVFENRVTLSNVPVLLEGTRYYISISGPGFWLSSTAPGSEWWFRSGESDAWRNASAGNPNNLSFELF